MRKSGSACIKFEHTDIILNVILTHNLCEKLTQDMRRVLFFFFLNQKPYDGMVLKRRQRAGCGLVYP